ncbi:MAG: hypothetical protein JNM22_17095 [Saprospiraceae bacterium]|nr:hypothetical protein [Saprospiraceae bacterium]
MPDPIRQRYDADALLSQMPGGILKWGNTMFLIATGVLLALAWFIRYPQTVQTAFTIPASAQPELVRTPVEGRLIQRCCADSSYVLAGDTLGIIECRNEQGVNQIFPLKSVQEGRMTAYLPVQVNEKVEKNQPLFVITRENAAPTAVVVQLPASVIGHIQADQEALLYFDAYAPETYGSVQARVQDIGKIAIDDQITVRLAMTEGLVSNRQIALNPAFGISGRAEIIIDNPRLIEKVVQPLQMLLNRQRQQAKQDSTKPLYTQKGD